MVLIDCDDERFQRRYTEARRPHSLAGNYPATDCIRLESRIVSPPRDRADFVSDISNLTAAELGRLLKGFSASKQDVLAFSLRLFRIVSRTGEMPVWCSMSAILDNPDGARERSIGFPCPRARRHRRSSRGIQ